MKHNTNLAFIYLQIYWLILRFITGTCRVYHSVINSTEIDQLIKAIYPIQTYCSYDDMQRRDLVSFVSNETEMHTGK